MFFTIPTMTAMRRYEHFWENAGARWVAVAGIALALVAFGEVWLGQTTRPVQAASTQSREAGAMLFHEKGCEHCHGADGRGTDKGPDLATVGKRRKKPMIELQIEKGGAEMPAFGDVLQPDEVKQLVDFLSAKRKVPR
jgi:mono/diheme cytochrome c family protein